MGTLESEVRSSSKQDGISKMACIACVVDPHGAAYCRSYNWGYLGCADAERILSHVKPGSTIVVDGLTSYKSPASSLMLERIKVDGKNSEDEINLNAVNSFHSQIKQLLRFYRGVSVKYINRYCALFSLRWTIKVKNASEILSYIKDLLWDFRMKENYFKVFSQNLWNPLGEYAF